MKQHIVTLKRLRACGNAVEYAAKHDTLEAAWNNCERGDWLLWLAAKAGVDRKLVVSAACDCAETSSYLWTDDRPRLAIETARRWVLGEATIEEVRSAAAAAAAAADAAYAAAAAAAYAAYAAYAAAYAADAYAADAADARKIQQDLNLQFLKISASL